MTKSQIISQLTSNPEFLIETVVNNNYPAVRDRLESENYHAENPAHAISIVNSMYDKQQDKRVDYVLNVPWLKGVSGLEYDQAIDSLNQSESTGLRVEPVTMSILSIIGGITNITGKLIKDKGNQSDTSPTLDRIAAEKAARVEAERKRKNTIVIGSIIAAIVLILIMYYVIKR